ncbi:MAG TPA: sugar kinase [Cyclobacteriaceae bacterium]|jgi:2-dehydro-3-deoxygluconokinase|nr:sugar kinase [Cytophagales bacterium]HMR58137.1 sugar kinase [Cyclobacteriaceae bacterium]HNT51167.1 sugar kinase [Cyclobacteriaceae bacterium]HRE68343.1 sugar kinase [Cyclobacteriaceae bacterium]HRF33907.1 sugar kinase [Cyclobacteriaceae bacterium]
MKKVVSFGDVMMRLSTPGHSRFGQVQNFEVRYAGSEANVTAALAGWGVGTAHVTRFPDNDFGVAATEVLRMRGVDTAHILYGSERLGIYFLENGAMQRASRIVYDRFDSAFAHIKPGMIDWNEILQDAAWFHWSGITPALSQGAADVCIEAIEAARKYNVPVSGDINYRRNLWQYGKQPIEVMPALISMSDMVVGGITDFENSLGITEKDFESVCKAVMKAYPVIKKIAATERESISSSHNKISALLFSGKTLHKSKMYDLTHIVDRVGAGDAFMAGLIYGWLHAKPDANTLEFATASCALKHSIEGDVNLCTVEEIEALVRDENVGKLLR